MTARNYDFVILTFDGLKMMKQNTLGNTVLYFLNSNSFCLSTGVLL